MPVCRFFLQGNCKFGNTCKNEHPSRSNTGSNRNPFAPLQESSSNRSPSNLGRAPANKNSQSLPFSLNRDTIIADLSTEHPQWVLSAYGPGIRAPIQLFGGLPREQSFEEMRVRHYQLAASGKQQEAIQEAQSLVTDAENQMKQALADVDGAMQYIVDGERQHPNRIDICQASLEATHQSQSPFNNHQASIQTQSPGPGIFGRGSTTTGGQSVSQGSAFGNSQGSTFGQPSFGQPSFGQSSFGQPSFGQSSFGQSSTMSKPASAFGQSANSLGATPNQTSSPFSASKQPNTFQQSSQPNPFAAGGQNQSPKPFGAGAVNQVSGGFGQSSLPSTSAAMNDGPGTAASSLFASMAAGKPNAQEQSMAAPFNAFSGTKSLQMSSAFANNGADASQRQPTSAAQFRRDNQGKVVSWNGKDVSYIDDEPCYRGPQGELRRIWFPDGPPTFAKPSGVPEDAYDLETQAKYEYLKENGHFRHGKIPLVPPKKEWCMWNL